MTGPQFRLTAGSGWTVTASESTGAAAAGGFRNSRWDRPALGLITDPSWLLAPLYVRDLAGLVPRAGAGGAALPGPLDPPPGAIPSIDGVDRDAASADWPGWWRAALAFRPGTPAPRVDDLIAESTALQALWSRIGPEFATWLAARPRPTADDERAPRRVERAALAGFAARNGRDPGRWAVHLLQIPVGEHFLSAPDQRRIVVSAALRHDPGAYPEALAAELPRHF